MNRRDSLKALLIGSVSAGAVLEACNTGQEKGKMVTTADSSKWAGNHKDWEENSGRQPEEIKRDQGMMEEKFFTDGEMKTIAVLADIIIPKDDKSGSATDAGVPDFIEFIVKDMPSHQTPMRGGLRWLDMQCLKRYGKGFSGCSKEQQMEMVDEIAWPKKAKPEMQAGVNFFNLMRNLTATGFFSSKIGIADLGYAGNTPNVWDGVPADVLKQYGYAYDEKMLEVCVKAEDHDKLFTFDS
ncbi:gluconate 2-dehydrogenase subunit 3 family protein [Compostibacter hankyongensis]|uniref:Gluconate 2-dehydrogenase subunit 3 family protein n=1 Tax=Compostibacter hankyongensis TaxID=1007089 RepID=A0ABP8FCT1_9BACT